MMERKFRKLKILDKVQAMVRVIANIKTDDFDGSITVSFIEIMMSQGLKMLLDLVSQGQMSLLDFEIFCSTLGITPSSEFNSALSNYARFIPTVSYPDFEDQENFSKHEKNLVPFYDYLRSLCPQITGIHISMLHEILTAIRTRNKKVLKGIRKDYEKISKKVIKLVQQKIQSSSSLNSDSAVTLLKLLLRTNTRKVWKFQSDLAVISNEDNKVFAKIMNFTDTDINALIRTPYNPHMIQLQNDTLGFITFDELDSLIDEEFYKDDCDNSAVKGYMGKPEKHYTFGGKQPRNQSDYRYKCDMKEAEDRYGDLKTELNEAERICDELQRELAEGCDGGSVVVLEGKIVNLEKEIEELERTDQQFEDSLQAKLDEFKNAADLRINELNDQIREKEAITESLKIQITQHSQQQRTEQPSSSSLTTSRQKRYYYFSDDVTPTVNKKRRTNDAARDEHEKGNNKFNNLIGARVAKCVNDYPRAHYGVTYDDFCKGFTESNILFMENFNLVRKAKLFIDEPNFLKCCKKKNVGKTVQPCQNFIYCKSRMYWHRACYKDDLKKYKGDDEITTEEAGLIITHPFFCYACVDNKTLDEYVGEKE